MSADKQADEITVAGSEAKPTAHLHQRVLIGGAPAEVRDGQSFYRVAPRELRSAHHDLPDGNLVEVRGVCLSCAVDYEQRPPTVLNSLHRFTKFAAQLVDGPGHWESFAACLGHRV